MILEPWKALVLILVEQLTMLVVLGLTAWESAQEQRRNRTAQARLEARLVELNARLEARFGELKAQLARRKKQAPGQVPAAPEREGRR